MPSPKKPINCVGVGSIYNSIEIASTCLNIDYSIQHIFYTATHGHSRQSIFAFDASPDSPLAGVIWIVYIFANIPDGGRADG